MSSVIWRPTRLPIDPANTPDAGYGTMRVTSAFGWRPNPLGIAPAWHGGIDIGNARLGDEVVADADGRVAAVGLLKWPWSQPVAVINGTPIPEGNYGGLMVVLEHAGWCSVYAHLATATVVVGQAVLLGTKIGTIGATGAARVGGGHLHYGHVMRSVLEVATRGSVDDLHWTRDPWTVIDPTGEAPLIETRAQRIERQVLELRTAKPLAARRWREWTGLSQARDGEILSRAMRLVAEKVALDWAPDEPA